MWGRKRPFVRVRPCLSASHEIVGEETAVFNIHSVVGHLSSVVGNGRFYPCPSVYVKNLGRNGRFSVLYVEKLGENGRFWVLHIEKLGENGRLSAFVRVP
ncbi:MAG: hypothetical protein KC423_30105 [Anaerolineales bacterium]|nr:hypothetical protein [Anaerolineales bacterium]MCB9431198.1 hypothetical protein [Ardenticatenaceae bacterium]